MSPGFTTASAMQEDETPHSSYFQNAIPFSVSCLSLGISTSLSKVFWGNFEALLDNRPLGEDFQLMGLYLSVTKHHTLTDSSSRVLLTALGTSQFGLLISFSNL